MILTGVAFGMPADYGRAWPTVASAVDYVATLKPAAPAPASSAWTDQEMDAAHVQLCLAFGKAAL